MTMLHYTPNTIQSIPPVDDLHLFAAEQTDKVQAFHQSMGDLYHPTPLVPLHHLAQDLGIAALHIKDESQRGCLKAFKLLGGAYAVAQTLCQRLNRSIENTTFHDLQTDEVKQQLGDLVFAAASDGNHGKSVAWAAHQFNQRAVIYMPKDTAKDRIDAIEAYGGTVVVSEYNYDWCVREVQRLADTEGWIALPDTASEGNEQAAIWVMQGYSTMAKEAIQQLGDHIPTHLFLQAGVGSMAAAVSATFALHYQDQCPAIYILEPHQAACYYASGIVGDGSAHSTHSLEDSMMAGLSCGVPNPISWRILRHLAKGFFSCDDVLAANGMRILASPLPKDPSIVSGESGSIGTGFLDCIVRQHPDLCAALNLNQQSSVILFSTEGDTDRHNYRDVVWYGKHSDA